MTALRRVRFRPRLGDQVLPFPVSPRLFIVGASGLFSISLLPPAPFALRRPSGYRVGPSPLTPPTPVSMTRGNFLDTLGPHYPVSKSPTNYPVSVSLSVLSSPLLNPDMPPHPRPCYHPTLPPVPFPLSRHQPTQARPIPAVPRTWHAVFPAPPPHEAYPQAATVKSGTPIRQGGE